MMRTRLRMALVGGMLAWLVIEQPAIAKRDPNNCVCDGTDKGWRFVLVEPLCGVGYFGQFFTTDSDGACEASCEGLAQTVSPRACSYQCSEPGVYPSQYSYEACWYNSDTGNGGCFGPTYNYC
jgi:hypothetical protein